MHGANPARSILIFSVTAVVFSFCVLTVPDALPAEGDGRGESAVASGPIAGSPWYRLNPQLSDRIRNLSFTVNGGLVGTVPSDGLIVRRGDGSWVGTSPEYWPGVWFGDVIALDELPGVVMASTVFGDEEHGGCVFRSTDHGETWTVIDPDPSSNTDAYYRFGSSRADPSRVYLTAYGDLWASDDAGQSWYSIAHGYSEVITTDVAVHPVDPDVILVGSRGTVKGIFRSTDGGQSWTRTGSELHATFIEWDPLDPDLVMAVGMTDTGKHRFTRSTDGGWTWTAPEVTDLRGSMEFAGAPGVAIASGVASGDAGALFSTRNGGLSWHVLAEFGELGDLTAWDAAVVAGRLVLAAAIDRNGVFVSLDRGRSWHPAGPSRGLVRKVVTDPYRPGRGIAGTDDYQFALVAGPGHRFLTEDGGRTWSDLEAGGWPGVGQVTCALFSHTDPGEIHIGSDYLAGTLAYSLDNGATWSQCAPGLPRPRCLIRSPHDSDILYVGHDRSLSFPTIPPGVWMRDEEWNWTRLWESPHPVRDLCESSVTEGLLYAALGETDIYGGPAPGGGLFTSGDGGASWTEVAAFSGVHVAWIRQSPGLPEELWAGTMFDTGGDRVYRSVDGGESWIDVSSDFFFFTVRDLLFLEGTPGRCFAATDHGVLESTDGGDTWRERNEGLLVTGVGNDLLSLNAYSIDADESAGTLAVGTRTGIFGCTYSSESRQMRRLIVGP